MSVVELSEENLEDFRAFLGEDLTEDVKRVYYNGIGVTDEDGDPLGALVYELLNSESEEDTKSRICLAKSDSKESFDSMESYYTHTSMEQDEVVESFYELEDESEAKALNGTGFSMEKKEDDFLLTTLGELGNTALGKKRKIPDHIGNISALSVLQFRKAMTDILFKGYTGILGDLPFLSKNWFENRISACVSSGGKIPGFFLIHQTPSGILMPSMLFAYGPEYQKNLLFMITYSLQQALSLYPSETKIRVPRKNTATKALTDKFLPNLSGAEIFFGTRKEN